jgi:TonB-dependent receptor
MADLRGRALLRFGLLTSAAVIGLVAGPAQAQSADELETVVVTGFRASLQKAIELKREEVGVRDSIVAEDMGKYPASNIAESLTRVPGVVLSRDTVSNEGQRLTVRGLDASYTVVTVNGIPVKMQTGDSAYGSSSRAVDLDAFGADLFNRVDFYKTPAAELSEGGIGGVVDLRTPHPFDYTGFKASYSLGVSDNTNRNKGVPRGSFQVSDTWGPFGALIAVSALKSSNEIEGTQYSGIQQARNEFGKNDRSTTYDFGPGRGGYDARANIGSYTVDQINQAFVPRFARNYLNINDRIRYSGLLSLQYKPSERFDTSFDLMVAQLSDMRQENDIGVYFRSTGPNTADYSKCVAGTYSFRDYTGCSALVPINVGVDPTNNNLYGTFANANWYNENRWHDSKDKFISGTWTAKYKLTDALTVTADGAISDAHSFYSDNRIYMIAYNSMFTWDPRHSIDFPLMTTDADLTNPARYATPTAKSPAIDANYYKQSDRVVAGKVKADYILDTGIGVLGRVTLQSGLEYVATKKGRDGKTGYGAVVGSTYILSNGQPLGTAPASAYWQNHLPVSNFLSGYDHGPTITNWMTVPRSFYLQVGFNDILDAQPSSMSSVYEVTEAVKSAYVQGVSDGTILGKSFRINTGLRLALTQMYGYNYASSKDTSGAVIYTKQKLHSSYDNLLPSLSLQYDVIDDVTLRASYGRTITRASLDRIAQGTSIPSRFTAAASTGNPDLKPLLANNIDFGAEWYFAPESVLSVGVFYKGLKNLVAVDTQYVPFSTLNLPDSSLDLTALGTTGPNGTKIIDPNLTVTLNGYKNLNPLVVKGFEVYFQQPFTFLPDPLDGFGTLLSFTYTAGAAGGDGTGFKANDGTIYKMPIAGLATYAYSASLYYEKEAYSVRASYNWRSKITTGDLKSYYSTNLQQMYQARGQLDGTVAYKFSDAIELRMDVSNLLNEKNYMCFMDPAGNVVPKGTLSPRVAGYGSCGDHRDYDNWYGRTYTLSIRGRF